MLGCLNNAVFEQTAVPVIVLDKRDDVMFYNKAAKGFDFLRGTPIAPGVPYLDIISSERKGLVEYILSQTKVKGNTQTSEAEYKDKNGRSFYFEVSYNPIYNTEGEPVQTCVVSHEITPHKIFEKKSMQLVREFSGLIENANAIIFSVDSRGYVTEWNNQSARLTQLSKNDVFAQKIERVIDPAYHDGFKKFLQAIFNGEVISNYELPMKSGENTIITLVNATPKFNTSGEVIGATFVGQDITELSNYRNLLEQKVQDRTEKLRVVLENEKQMVEEKKRFVSVASHEFKIPISAIEASAKFISSNPKLRKRDGEALQNILKQAEMMRTLLNDILTVRKGEVNLLKPTYANIELIGLLKTIIAEVCNSTNSTHKVQTEFSHPEIFIMSDEKLLRNIMVNVISNAIKFSPGANEVLLSVRFENDILHCRVTDKGIGIAADDMEKVFQPFNRGKNVGEIKGTGLGLSIVRKAVEALEGNLKIESAVGAGTSIAITFDKNPVLKNQTNKKHE
ncbi:MAG TPA: PAS domain-containing sensor histidine kinase [Ohtaekwangia sp.]|nr:PAS domain-containing sensor histidine kinase [Ohtaekwangia sp.]